MVQLGFSLINIQAEIKEERKVRVKEKQQVDLEQRHNEEEERAAQLAKVAAFVLPLSHSSYTIATAPAADSLGITIDSRCHPIEVKGILHTMQKYERHLLSHARLYHEHSRLNLLVRTRAFRLCSDYKVQRIKPL